jgi:ABC-2 type transport system ATP-binding protein
MSELEDTADHLIVIGKGRLLADLSVDQLIATASDGQVEITTPDVSAAMTVLANAGATPVSNGGGRLTVRGIAASQVSRLLSSNGIALEQLVTTRATLEDAYFRLTHDAQAHSGTALHRTEAAR